MPPSREGRDVTPCWISCPWHTQSLLVSDCNLIASAKSSVSSWRDSVEKGQSPWQEQLVLLLGSEWNQGIWILEVAACVPKRLAPLFVRSSPLWDSLSSQCLLRSWCANGGFLKRSIYLSFTCHLTLRSVNLAVHLGQILLILSGFCSGNEVMLLAVSSGVTNTRQPKRTYH